MNRRTFATLAAVAVACAPIPSNLPPGDGALTVDWTIASSNDPPACAGVDAASLQLDVFGPTGSLYSHQLVPCAKYTVTATVPAAFYSTDAILLDPDGKHLTRPVAVTGVQVVDGQANDVPVDFPPSSFL